jgi:hypothetical protein
MTTQAFIGVSPTIAYTHWLLGHQVAVIHEGDNYSTFIPKRTLVDGITATQDEFLRLIAARKKPVQEFGVYNKDHALVSEREIIINMLWRCLSCSK